MGMAKPRGEEKLEGLELISIGSLYSGPWDKKYWSCSRGKERYPYPVGYQAHRAHGGSICKMEIREGPQGPLFIITGRDGESCGGQTPDIAWDKFQKKGAVPSGRRFPCKTDGIEFFGFKNLFVQRLLRQLVANINAAAECSTFASRFCNVTSVAEHRTKCPESGTGSNLLAYIARPAATRKRSKRHRTANPRPLVADGSGLHRPGDSPCISGALNSTQVESKPPFEPNLQHVFLGLVPSSAAKSVSGDGTGFLPAKEAAVASSETCLGNSACISLSAKQRLLDRTQSIEMEGPRPKLLMEENAGDAPASSDSQGVKDLGLCVPDTLDCTEDSAANLMDKDNCVAVKESIRNRKVIFGGLVTESHQDAVVSTSNSYSGSEKSDFDSVGQDIAKSMMTVLLPQAIPLLKETSRKKRKLPTLVKNLGGSPKSVEEASDGGQCADSQPVEAPHSAIPDSELVKSVIHDSFDDLCFDHVVNDIMWPNDREVDQHCCNNDAYPPCVKDDENLNESNISHETDESKDIFCVDETKPALVEQPQSGLAAAKSEVEEKDSNSSICNKVVATRNASLRDVGTSEQLSEKDTLTEVGSIRMDNLTEVPLKIYARRNVATAASAKKKHSVLLSESIIYRHLGDDSSLQELTGTCPDSSAFRARSSSGRVHDNKFFNSEPRGLQQLSDGYDAELNCFPNDATPFPLDEHYRNHAHPSLRDKEPKSQPDNRMVEREDAGDISGPQLQLEDATQFCHTKTLGNANNAANLNASLNRNIRLKSELNGYYELVGCYFHPREVSSLLLRTEGTQIFICALCGVPMENLRTLFLYKLALEKPRTGFPSFIGHTAITLPSYKDVLAGIANEKSGLQLTPDGQSLAMLGSIRAPCCREQRTDCWCQICASDGVDCTTVKIAQVKCGYVSILVKLRTVDNLKCLLVCGPNHLAVAGEGGRLHVWTMNLTWRAAIEEFCIPANYERCYSTVELKRIPKCASLIVGHNGVGEFLLWDISKRAFLSRFSAPRTSIFQFSPISVFSWSQEVSGPSYFAMEDKINRMLDATRLWSSDQSENSSFPSLLREDPAIWLLVSTASSDDTQPMHISDDPQRHQWRLALLVKSMLIFGNVLDPRAAAIGTSACHGLIGTNNGLVYAWDLLSGSKLGTLHDFKGGGVSCIATDYSKLGALAVAGGTGQLLVYQQSQPYAF